MAYDVKAIREDDYLHAIVTGDNTPADVAAYLGQVRKICAESGLSKVLIEENLAGPRLDTVDVYDVVVAASADVAPAIRQVAFVDTNPEHDFANIKFGETVAVNRGVNAKVFRDVPSAVEWIRRRWNSFAYGPSAPHFAVAGTRQLRARRRDLKRDTSGLGTQAIKQSHDF